MGNSGLGGCVIGALLAVPGLAQDLGIQVNVFNYAEVSNENLEAAKEIASRVLSSAGLTVTWEDYPVTLEEMKACERCQELPNPTTFTLRLLPDSMVRSWPNNRHHLAYSVVAPRGEFGKLTGIYASRVENVARREHFPLELVLGHVIAHEVGHLLLGPDSHSRHGVMRFPVNRDYLHLASKRQLRFTPRQARSIELDVRSLGATLEGLRNRGDGVAAGY